MTDARKDSNRVSTMLGTSNADGETPLNVRLDPTTHAIDTDDGVTGSDKSGDNATRDNNRVTTLLGVSSADGLTPVAIYIDSVSNKLLIKTT